MVPSALELKYLSSRSALECAMKSAMGFGFKSKRETRYEHIDDCQIPLTYTKDSSRVKQEAAKIRHFCQMSRKGVKLGGVRQIHKQRPGSLPLYCRKPKIAVLLQDKVPLCYNGWIQLQKIVYARESRGLKTKQQVRECYLQGHH